MWIVRKCLGYGSKAATGVGREEAFANSGNNAVNSKPEEELRTGNKNEDSDSQKHSKSNGPSVMQSSALNVIDVLSFENDVSIPRSFTSSQFSQNQHLDVGFLSRQMEDAANVPHHETPFIAQPSLSYAGDHVRVILSSPTYPSLQPSVDRLSKGMPSRSLASCSPYRDSYLHQHTSRCFDVDGLLHSRAADTFTVSMSPEVYSRLEIDSSMRPGTEDLAIMKDSVNRIPTSSNRFLFPSSGKASDRNSSLTTASSSESIVFSLFEDSRDAVHPRRPDHYGAAESSPFPVLGRLYRQYAQCLRGSSDFETLRSSVKVPGSGGTGQTKKHQCDLCGRAFSRTNTLITHRVSRNIARTS